jgi:beta-phosphoglucomutase-like phosphatase (HAD superfamily)
VIISVKLFLTTVCFLSFYIHADAFCTEYMKYTAVLFDLDGVIIDSEPIHFESIKQDLAQHGYLLSDSDYTSFFVKRTDAAGFEAYFNNVNHADSRPDLEYYLLSVRDLE